MLNRRILSQLAVTEPLSFRSIVEHIKETQVVALPRYVSSTYTLSQPLHILLRPERIY